MPSKSWKQFDENFEDIELIVDLGKGLQILDREDGKSSEDVLDVLYRSAIVLMVSHWEAYVEDVCSEALTVLIDNVKSADDLPKEIKKQVAKEVRDDKNEIAVWTLADNGWKKYLHSRLDNFKEARDWTFNSPKSAQTEDFINKTIGLPNISSAWKFGDHTPSSAKEKLDKLIKVRGQIAHRGKLDQEISEEWLTEHIKFLRKIISKTGGKINTHLKKVTGKGLWKKKKKKG